MKKDIARTAGKSGKNQVSKDFLLDVLAATAAIEARDARVEDEFECKYRSKSFQVKFYAEGRVVLDTEREETSVSDLAVYFLEDKDRKFDLKKMEIIDRPVLFLIENQLGQKVLEDYQSEILELLEKEEIDE